MNAQKMTQKSLEALQAAQSLAVEYENQALCPEHLFCALPVSYTHLTLPTT